MNRVVITGRALSSPLGRDLSAQFESWRHGKTAFTANQEFLHTPVRFAGMLEDCGTLPDRKIRKVITRKDQIGIVTAISAADNAGICRGSIDPQRFGMYVGAGCTQLGDLEPYYELLDRASSGGQFSSRVFAEGLMSDVNPMVMMQTLMNNTLCYTAIHLDIRGVNGNFMDFQNAGMRALMEGFFAIREGRADVVLVGGVTATPEPYHADQGVRMGYLAAVQEHADRAIRPFDAQRCGTILSEGSCFLVLESAQHAKGRGARSYGELRGVASASDARFAFVDEASSPGLEKSLSRLLKKCGAPDFLMADASGGQISDRIEYLALEKTFGDRLAKIPVHAAKSTFGELSESSGLANTILGLEAIHSGQLPPTRNLYEIDPQFLMLKNEEYHPKADHSFVTYTRSFSGSSVAVFVDARI